MGLTGVPWGKFTPYSLICLVGFVCHGLILTNDGTIWDGWWMYNWVKTRNWPVMHELFSAGGTPLYYWLYRPFAWFPNIMAAFMWASFLSILAGSFLTYRLALRLSSLSRGEALTITLLALAMPVFTAAQEMMLFYYLFSDALFLASAWLATSLIETTGWRHWVLRGLVVAGFLLSFANASLLVFYGGFYVLLFMRYVRIEALSIKIGIWRFLKGYPDLFLLPPAGWASRVFITPQRGWYATYNMPGSNLANLEDNLWSFFENVLPSHAARVLAGPLDHPVMTIAMLVVAFVCYRFGPREWSALRGPTSTARLACFGVFLLFCAVFPFAAAGKSFPYLPEGESSRHCLLTPLPLAILSFAAVRWVLFWRGRLESRLLAPVAGCMVVVLGSQIPPVYAREQVEWIFSKAVLHGAVRNEIVRNSSVVATADCSLIAQETYGIFGLATAFGDITRFGTGIAPANRSFFTPSELQKKMLLTTVLPSTYQRINPAGQQTLLLFDRQRGSASDWDLVFRHFALRNFGTEKHLDDFLANLITMKTLLYKPATPLTPALNPPVEPGASFPAGNGFSNSIGMRMSPMPGRWWAARFETTQAEFERLMGRNPSLFQDPRRPVECVSWHDAMDFCLRLAELEGKAGRLPPGFTYRLPTVAEFDQMAAGASSRKAVTSMFDLRWHTAPVGSMPASANGLHDVLGNVWEWCLDWWDDAHLYKISKGGAWLNTALDLMPDTSSRNKPDWNLAAGADRLHGPVRRDYPDQGFWDRGFRCVLAPIKPPQ